MKNNNIENFIKIFKGLDPNDQLKIANAIVESLHLSDNLLREDGYDRDLSSMVMPILEDYVSKQTNKEKLKNTKELITKFNELPSSNKANIIEGLEDKFKEGIEREKQFLKFQESKKK